MYRIVISAKVWKTLVSVPQKDLNRIKTALFSLANQPRPGGCKKLSGGEAFRIRIGHYRVIYQIDDRARIVFILKAGHRKNIYN